MNIGCWIDSLGKASRSEVWHLIWCDETIILWCLCNPSEELHERSHLDADGWPKAVVHAARGRLKPALRTMEMLMLNLRVVSCYWRAWSRWRNKSKQQRSPIGTKNSLVGSCKNVRSLKGTYQAEGWLNFTTFLSTANESTNPSSNCTFSSNRDALRHARCSEIRPSCGCASHCGWGELRVHDEHAIDRTSECKHRTMLWIQNR
jgi:hypothetical protein